MKVRDEMCFDWNIWESYLMEYTENTDLCFSMPRPFQGHSGLRSITENQCAGRTFAAIFCWSLRTPSFIRMYRRDIKVISAQRVLVYIVYLFEEIPLINIDWFLILFIELSFRSPISFSHVLCDVFPEYDLRITHLHHYLPPHPLFFYYKKKVSTTFS